MTSGYCKACDRLVQIKAKPIPRPTECQPMAKRQQEWYPAPHPDENGDPCKGVRSKV